MNQDNKIMEVFARIVDLLILNFLFVITSIPFFTLGASLTALFSVTLKMVRNEESYIAKDYFHAFKKNFSQATPCFLIFTLLFALLSGNLFLSYGQNGTFFLILRMVSILFILFIMIYFIYFFPVMARFYFNTRQILLHIPHMILTHLTDFIFLIVMLAPLCFLALYSLYTAACVALFGCICGFSLYAFIMSFLFRRIFAPYELH